MQEGPQMQSKGASMESVERRMLMHVGSVGVCTHAASMADPLRLRGLMEARMLHKQHNMVKARSQLLCASQNRIIRPPPPLGGPTIPPPPHCTIQSQAI